MSKSAELKYRYNLQSKSLKAHDFSRWDERLAIRYLTPI